MSEVPIFIFDNIANWTWGQRIGFFIGNFIALEILGWIIFLWETPNRPRIPPGGPLVMERGLKDWIYIFTNKLGTGLFNYHTFQYCWHYAGKGVYWNLNEMTFMNTVVALPLLFLAYDLPYSLFHRFLHHASVYGYVHKHHHKQRAPIYGNDDAINTHPIEFWIGAYLHLFAIYIVPVHMVTVLVFLILITLFSAWNHTRFEMCWGKGYLYDNKEHDTHHKLLTCNYAAYTQFWDVLFGTYREWTNPAYDYMARKPPTPDMCKPDACKANYERAMTANDAPRVALVTGGGGLVGARLVSMLVQRGANKVISVDLNDVHADVKKAHLELLGKEGVAKISYVKADICDVERMTELCRGVEVVFNVAAIVGPYYPIPLYDRVNNVGARNVVEACKRAGVRKLVMTSSPSTRMDGSDIYNLKEEELPDPMSFTQLQEYARTKALGENYTLSQNSPELLTCALGPHQVYGPLDRLFLPNFLETAKNGRLRILGTGENIISFTHVDNCAHAHILAAKALVDHKSAPAGKYYTITDGGANYMWDAINSAVMAAGYQSLRHKFNVNTILLYPIAYICLAISKLTGRKIKLNPFVVKMCSMNRYFSIENLCKDIGYRPIRSFEEAWPETVASCLKFMGIPQVKPVEVGSTAAFAVVKEQASEKAKADAAAMLRQIEAESSKEVTSTTSKKKR